MSGDSKWCETSRKFIYKKCPDGCVCVCACVKTSKTYNVCISGISQPLGKGKMSLSLNFC